MARVTIARLDAQGILGVLRGEVGTLVHQCAHRGIVVRILSKAQWPETFGGTFKTLGRRGPFFCLHLGTPLVVQRHAAGIHVRGREAKGCDGRLRIALFKGLGALHQVAFRFQGLGLHPRGP